MEFWRDFKLLLKSHLQEFFLIYRYDGVISWTEKFFLKNEAIGEKDTNMLLYFLDILMKNSSKYRNEFNKMLYRVSPFNELQKKWNMLRKIFKSYTSSIAQSVH